MTVTNHLTLLQSAIQTVPGIDSSRVVIGRRLIKTGDDLVPELWEIERTSVSKAWEGTDLVRVVTEWSIEGWRPWRSGTQEELFWQERIEAVARAVEHNSQVLGAFDQLGDGEFAGLQVRAAGQVNRLGTITCRGALCTLPTLHFERAT